MKNLENIGNKYRQSRFSKKKGNSKKKRKSHKRTRMPGGKKRKKEGRKDFKRKRMRSERLFRTCSISNKSNLFI
jgi:hypothetical protein